VFYYCPPAASVSSYGASSEGLPLVPPMAYVAPECVLGGAGGGGGGRAS